MTGKEDEEGRRVAASLSLPLSLPPSLSLSLSLPLSPSLLSPPSCSNTGLGSNKSFGRDMKQALESDPSISKSRRNEVVTLPWSEAESAEKTILIFSAKNQVL
jgi:hypothetical protein